MSFKKEVGAADSSSDPETKDLGLTNVASVEAGHGDQRELDFMTRNGLNLESFKRRDNTDGVVQLDKTMKSRHLNMISIGGSIGAGFFVGSGGALTKGGPGSVLLCFSIAGLMMFNVVHALGELAVMYPVSGGFYTYSTRFIDRSWGFAMGWNYVFQWLIVLPFELVVCSFTVAYWNKEVNPAVWITLFWVFIILINIFGTLGYAEEEFWSSCLKLGATVVFMIIAIILVCGGGPSGGRYDEFWGDRLWKDPGAFRNGFPGFCSVFVTAAFSYAGTELVGLAAAESSNPARSLPSAVKQVFWRITTFYVLGLTLVGLLVSSTDENLLNSSNPYADGVSPFVLAGKYAGLNGFDHFMNLVICISVVSIGVSSVYGSSRTLTALAEQDYAPKVFTYIDKSGRPLVSVVFTMIFGALAYVSIASGGMAVFDWLLSLSAMSSLITWGSICFCHIRFRAAWVKQGRSMDLIPYKAVGGVYGSWLGLILCILIFAGQLYVAAVPYDGGENTPSRILQNILTIPVVVIFWVIGYFWKRPQWVSVDNLDLDTGLRQHNWDEINEYRAKIAALPAWWQFIRGMFA